MLKNYFKTAFRNLWRNKAFTAINIGGLAIGMASAMLILLWIQNEVSFDAFYKNTDRIYLMYNRENLNGEYVAWHNTPAILGKTLKQEFPEVENYARMRNADFLLSVGDKHVNSRGSFTDSGFFALFDFPLVSGDRSTLLHGEHDIVLTQKLALTLFGKEDALGKTIRIDSNAVFTVAGVLKDLPPNTSFTFDYLMPWSYRKKLGLDSDDWGLNAVDTYILLGQGVNVASFDNRIRNIVSTHSKETVQVMTQPLKRDHLYGESHKHNGQLVDGQIRTVRMFSVIAAFILLIACINFMNLTTARSGKRAREVGVRKVVGAYRHSLILQFMAESIQLSLMAFILALLLVQVSLPGFDLLIGKHLTIQYSNPVFWLLSAGFVLLTGLLAGSYPAFYLSSFRPVQVLKGTFRSIGALVAGRKILVVVQFSFAILLIIGTLIVWRQIQYAQDREVGYNRNRLAFTYIEGDVDRHYELIRQELLSSGAVTAVTKSISPITRVWTSGWGYSWDGSTEADKRVNFIHMGSDADFVKTMGTTLLEGRDIDARIYPSDSMATLVNETAVNQMHMKDPVGKIISRDGMNWHIVGVIKDFILESPYQRNVTAMMIVGPAAGEDFAVIHFKLSSSMPTAASLQKVEKIFHQYNPDYPFDYHFADESYAVKFADEQRIGQLAALFAGLTIFISCMGLFGLATHMAESRIKEIGIRKILGASTTGLAALLAKDFITLVLVSFLIASPMAWVLMNKWLSNYDYRISIGWSVFAIAAVLATFIALLTVSYQSIRAALATPVKSLKAE